MADKILDAKLADEIADLLDDFFNNQKMDDCYVDETFPHLIVRDDDGNVWVDGDVFEFVLNECLGFDENGNLQKGFGAAEPYAEKLVEYALYYGVEPKLYFQPLEYTTFYGAREDVLPKINTYYNNNNLYLGLDFLDLESNMWQPFTDVTVNVGKLPFLESAIDTNNNGVGIVNFLVENGFGELTGKVLQSGFCTYPVFRFNEERLRQIDAGVFEKYKASFDLQPELNSQISKAAKESTVSKKVDTVIHHDER